VGFFLAIAVLAGAAGALASVGRLGWMGVPAAVLVMLGFMIAESELLALPAGMLAAAAAAATLPRWDRLLAVPAGGLGAWLLLDVLPNGAPDSPLNFVAAFACAGFALGGLLASLFPRLRLRRIPEQSEDGVA
jgi:uncharacterized membrane protein YccC